MLKAICSCCAADMNVEGSAFYIPCIAGIEKYEKHQLCSFCHETLMAEYAHRLILPLEGTIQPAMYISPPTSNGFVDIKFVDELAAKATLKLFRLDHKF